MKALWKLCLVGAAAVFGHHVAGPMVMPKGTNCEMFEMNVEESGWGLYWRPDTAGYPITLSTNLINSEGEAWRAAFGGYYRIMRPDGSFTELDINGVFIQSGTWFMIENFQIIDHPYQIKPVAVNIVYYRDNGEMETYRTYYTFNPIDFGSSIGVTPRNCYFRTKVPTE